MLSYGALLSVAKGSFVKVEMKLQRSSYSISCQHQKLVLQDSDQNLCWNGNVLFHILDERALSEDLSLNFLLTVWPG